MRYEELVELLQEGKIGYLRFVLEGENEQDYLEWFRTHGTDPSDESAEFYIEQTDISKNYWRSSKCRNLGIPRVCMPMPPLTVWCRPKAGSARYRQTSVWTVRSILLLLTGLLFP